MGKSAHIYNEPIPELAGFSEHFEANIAPKLRSRDQKRKRALWTARKDAALSFLVIFGIGLGLWLWLRWGFFIFVCIAVAPASAAMNYRMALQNIKSETKDRIVGAVVSYVGWSFNPPKTVFSLKDFKALELIPTHYEAAALSDRIEGPAHDAALRSAEAQLTYSGDSGDVTAFHGQLIELKFARPLGMGRTVVRRKGRRKRKGHVGLKPVGLVDPVWRKKFEAFSDDQVGARVALNPDFMQRMVDLEQSLNGENIRFGFIGTYLLIAVETGDLLEAGSMKSPLADPARVQRMIDEVATIFSVVDTLLKRSSA